MDHQPKHHLDLDHAVIWTEPFKLMRRLVEDVEKYRSMGVAHGNAGLGKSFGIDSALLAKATLPVVRLEFPKRTSQRYVARRIIKALTGLDETGGTFDLTERALEELSRRPVLIVVEEAQRLGGHIIEYLRMLHDDRTTDFGLILVGGNKCWEVLSREPMLRSRILRRVELKPWGLEATLEHIPTFHAIYHHATAETIVYVHEHATHGVLRDWVTFTATARDVCAAARPRLKTVDIEVAKAVFALTHGGTANAA